MVDVLVLGATGFTGGLIVRNLIQHPQRSQFTLGIAGRSESKLAALKSKLGVPDSVKTFIVDVNSQHEVDEVVKASRVVINAVGPYWRWGTPVVRACARFGKHYVDLTGEPHWLREIILQYDYAASKSRAIIVPAAGFDSVPSDLIVHLANKTLKALAGPETDIARSLSAFRVKGNLSGGSWSTLFTELEQVPRDKLAAASQDWSLSTHYKGLPQPGKQLVYELPFSSPPVVGGLWMMAGPNKAVVQRTTGLRQREASLSKSSEARINAYGPSLQYDEFRIMPSAFSAATMSLTMAFGLAILLFTPVRWLLKRLVPQPGEGMSEKEMREGFLKITNITSSVPTASKPATHVRTIIKGQGDPGYSLTSVIISECALALALSYDELPEFARRGGILTPASALGDVLVKRLEATGRMTFESEVVVGSEVESKKAR